MDIKAEFFKAIQNGNRDGVEQLLTVKPALIHERDESGLSPILVAAYYHEPEVAELLADRTVLLTIYEAAATGKITHIVRILAKQPDLVNACADDGYPPLGLAAFFGHHEVAEYLLKAGASVNAASHNAMKVTPLHSAVAAQRLEIADLLLKHGADLSLRESGGYTPLHIAAQNGDVHMIHQLLLNGADLRAKSEDGKTALDLAAEMEHVEAVEILKSEITKRLRKR